MLVSATDAGAACTDALHPDNSELPGCEIPAPQNYRDAKSRHLKTTGRNPAFQPGIPGRIWAWPQPNLRPKYLLGPPLLGGAVLLLQCEPGGSYGRGHWPGVRWLCVLPLLSVRDLNHPGPTPPLARIFPIFWRTLRFRVALVTVYSKFCLVDLTLQCWSFTQSDLPCSHHWPSCLIIISITCMR